MPCQEAFQNPRALTTQPHYEMQNEYSRIMRKLSRAEIRLRDIKVQEIS